MALRQRHEGLPVKQAGTDAVLGVIKENPALNNLFCRCYKHIECTKTRTHRLGRERGSGAPLGFLAAWCALQEHHADKASHMAARPSLQQRKAARASLALEPGYPHYHSLEERQGDAGDTEPEQVPNR